MPVCIHAQPITIYVWIKDGHLWTPKQLSVSWNTTHGQCRCAWPLGHHCHGEGWSHLPWRCWCCLFQLQKNPRMRAFPCRSNDIFPSLGCLRMPTSLNCSWRLRRVTSCHDRRYVAVWEISPTCRSAYKRLVRAHEADEKKLKLVAQAHVPFPEGWEYFGGRGFIEMFASILEPNGSKGCI